MGPIKTNQITLYALAFIAGLILSYITGLMAGTTSLWYIVPVTFFFTAFFAGDNLSVAPNERAVLVHRYNKKVLERDIDTGFYWTCGYSYYILDSRDSTVNKISMTVEGRTSNKIIVKWPVSVWLPLEDMQKYNSTGFDSEEKVKEDLDDSVRFYIGKREDEQIENLQLGLDGGITVEDLFHDRDTFWNTLVETGFLKPETLDLPINQRGLSIKFGKPEIPEKINEANTELTAAKKRAESEDFINEEKQKRVSKGLTDVLIDFATQQTTQRALREQAKAKLKITTDNITAKQDQLITEEALSIIKGLLPSKGHENYLSGKELVEMRKAVEKELSIREGRTKDFSGLSNSGARLEMKA